MKQALILFCVIIVIVVIYTLYGLFTFVPDKPQPFVFNNINLPQGIITNTQDNINLTPEEIANKERINEMIDNALEKFRDMRDTIPQQALETIDILTSQADNGTIPVYFLSDVDKETGKRKFETLNFEPTRWASIPAGKSTISCSIQNPPVDILVGNEENNNLECNLQNNIAKSDKLLLGGPGADTINDTNGNRIVNGGTGDDIIALGKGRTIIILDAAWGHDKLTVDCSDANIAFNQMDDTFLIKYPYQTTNFIILSPRINYKDLKWDGKVLRSLTTDDTLEVNENCFNIVPMVNG